MKKNLKIIIPVAIVIILAIVGIVFFTSGSKKEEQPKEIVEEKQTKEELSKEELLNQAIELDYTTINEEKYNNMARATEQYVGKTFKHTATITSIFSDTFGSGCFIGEKLSNGRYIKPVQVYLSKEDVLKLNKGDNITIVGKLNSLDMSTTLEIKPAYLISINN